MHESSFRRLTILLAVGLVTACSGTIGLGENRSAESALDAGSDGATSSGDGGGPIDGGSALDGSLADASTTCHCASSAEICVAHRTVGGAVLFPDDAGNCPVGRHVEGNFCQSDWTYSCEARPSGCSGTTVSCTCAATFCTDHGFGSSCTVRQSTSSDLECQLQAP